MEENGKEERGNGKEERGKRKWEVGKNTGYWLPATGYRLPATWPPATAGRPLPDAFFDDDDIAGAEGEGFFTGGDGAEINDMSSTTSAHGDVFTIGDA